MPFYKKTDTELLVAPTRVLNEAFVLLEDLHDTYTYPVDGWWWYADIDAAIAGLATSSASVTARQARLVLLAHGLLNTVDAAIANMPAAAKVEWEYATEIRRDSPLVAALASTLSLTSPDIDALFAEASQL
jgi:hypothetical protein